MATTTTAWSAVTASAKNPHAANKTSAQAGGKLTSIIPRPRSIVSNPYAPRTSQAKVSKVNQAQVSDNGGEEEWFLFYGRVFHYVVIFGFIPISRCEPGRTLEFRETKGLIHTVV